MQKNIERLKEDARNNMVELTLKMLGDNSSEARELITRNINELYTDKSWEYLAKRFLDEYDEAVSEEEQWRKILLSEEETFV